MKKPRKYYFYDGERLTVNKIAEKIGVNYQRLHRKLIDINLETDITHLVNGFAKEPVQIGGKRVGAGRFGEAGESKAMRIPLIYEVIVKEFITALNATKVQHQVSLSTDFKNPMGEHVDVNIELKKSDPN